MAAFDERWGRHLGEKLKMIPFRGSPDEYPHAVRERIRALQAQASRAGLEWPRRRDGDSGGVEVDLTSGGRLAMVGLGLLGPGLWALGVGTAVYLLAKRLSRAAARR